MVFLDRIILIIMKNLNNIKNPHDRFFKANMQDIRVARSFFEAHLPVKLTKLIDFNTLKLESASFIDKKLQEILSDLTYSVKIGDKDGYLYIITEHQSTPPDLMPFRNLQYNCGLMDQHLKQTPEGELKVLPLIINIVFYHGKLTPYTQSCDIFDYFANPELAREYMFKPFTLVDVNQISDEELVKHHWATLFEILQKHSRERDMLPFLEKLFTGKLNFEIHQYGDLFYLMVKYITETGEISDKKKFLELLTHTLPEGEKEMTTLAQDWMNEGYQKGIHAGMQQGIHAGIQQGIQQGMQQGIHAGIQQGIQQGIHAGMQQGEHEKAIAIAKNMLLKGATIDFVKEVTGLSDQDLAKLARTH